MRKDFSGEKRLNLLKGRVGLLGTEQDPAARMSGRAKRIVRQIYCILQGSVV